MNVDVKKPVENPKLSALLNEFKNCNDTNRQDLQEKIAEELAMNSHLLAIVDLDEDKIEKKGDNTYMLNGSLPIYEVEKLFDITIPEGDYDSISGYVIDLLGRLPAEKEYATAETENMIYKVEKVEDNRIIKIKATKKEVVTEEEESKIDGTEE